MAVLLQYNDADQWTMSQLAESTQIKKDILVQVSNRKWMTFVQVTLHSYDSDHYSVAYTMVKSKHVF